MTGHPVTPLISVAELAATAPSAALVLLDVRWTLAGSDPHSYRVGHIPGAVFVDLDRDLAARPGSNGRHPLPEALALQRLWRECGIDDDSTVVVYDGGNALAAARAWWLLRWSGVRKVQVLDGGLHAWTSDPARPVASGVQRPARTGTVTVVPGSMPVVDIDGAAALASSPDGVLLDARAPERFRGAVEPVDPVAGHIPGAVNLPATDLLTAAGTYRPATELTAILSTAGRAGPVPSAASCGSGVTACQLILAAEITGHRLALFPGSYSQWCAEGRPVATGECGTAGREQQRG